MHVYAYRGQKRASDLLKLELDKVVYLFLWKSSKCFSTTEPSFLAPFSVFY